MLKFSRPVAIVQRNEVSTPRAHQTMAMKRHQKFRTAELLLPDFVLLFSDRVEQPWNTAMGIVDL